MIRVEIPKKELLKQLPQKAGYALIQWLDELPDKFVFEGLPVQTKEEVLAGKFPVAREVLTKMEWTLVATMYGRGKVADSLLLNSIGYHPYDSDHATLETMSNVLAVHIKNLRRKIIEHKLPFRVGRVRAQMWGLQGGYVLKEVNF